MSCYHPLLAKKVQRPDGKFKLSFYSHKDNYGQSVLTSVRPDDYSFRKDENVFQIPCGKCVGCRLDYSRRWADRMLIEFSENNFKALFVTLTYNNEHIPFAIDPDSDLPVGFSLCKRDFQLFNKRLRKHFSEKTLRFFACGEYGSTTLRPHYHVIFFGLSLSDFSDCRPVGINELKQPYFTSSVFEHIWSNGFVCLADCSYNTFAYVTRYNLKKVFGDNILPTPFSEPSFLLMSRRPGIASSYYDSHPDICEFSSISLFDGNEVKKIPIPRSFFKKLSIDNPKLYDNIMLERRLLSKDKMLLRSLGSDLPYIEQLEIDEQAKLRSASTLFSSRKEVIF